MLAAIDIIGGNVPAVPIRGKVSGEYVRFIIGADKLMILNRTSGHVYKWPFEDIAAYRYGGFQSNTVLRITLKNGSKCKFVINDFFHGGQNFDKMVQQFEVAFKKYQRGGKVFAVLQEKTFFEKTMATFVLVVFAGLMAWLTWKVTTSHQHISGGFYTACGGFLAYVAAWYAACERRSES